MSNVSIQNTVNTWGKRPYLFIKGEQFKKKFSTFFFLIFLYIWSLKSGSLSLVWALLASVVCFAETWSSG